MQKISLAEKLSAFRDRWTPRIVGELNGQHVKLIKFQGEFVWRHHDAEDELFLVLQGKFRINYREPSGSEQSLEISAGEFVIVPRGMEHRPYAAEEGHVMLFEPAGTLNACNVRTELTMDAPALI